jgi:LysR family transcriptional regulator, hydrogen peroxide-inducible genes activator
MYVRVARREKNHNNANDPMELHQLRYVAAVAQTGSFSRAAEHCHVSQPSLSQQIQKLEDELGQRLFDRLPRKVRLAAAGELFLPRALRVIEELDLAQREVRDSQGQLRGSLTIGALPTIAPYLLPPVICAFSQKHPRVEVIVQEDTTARLLQLGSAGEIDLLIASLSISGDRFESELLFREELLLALSPDHPLANRKHVTLADLQAERFILMKEDHCLGNQVLDFCNRRDFHPQVSCRSAQIETVQALVQAGLGVSLVPRMAVGKSHAAEPLYRSLANPRPTRDVALLRHKRRPLIRAATAFAEHLHATAKTFVARSQ